MKVGIVMKIQKKHVISAALILALGAAVYVNWQFGASAKTTPKQLGEASYVSADVSSATADQRAVSTMSKQQESYFASERLKRQSTQDKAIDEAEKLFDLDGVSEDEQNEAQKTVAQLLKSFTVQDSIESILKAKGFSDCRGLRKDFDRRSGMSVSRCDLLEENDNNAKSLPVIKTGRLF